MDFHRTKRRDLQALCKKHNLAANGTNLDMADRLASHLKKPDLEPKPLKGLEKNDEVSDVDSSKVVGLEKNDEVKDVGSSKVVTRRAKKVRFCLEEVEQAKIVDLTKSDDENLVTTKKSSMKPGFERSTHKIEVIPVRMTRSRRGAEVASLPSSPVAKKKPRRGVDVESGDKEKEDTSETEIKKEEEPIASSVPVAKKTLRGKGAKKESEDVEEEISSVENLDDGGKSRSKLAEEVGARVTRSLRNTQVPTDDVEENLKKKDISPRKTRRQREEGKGEDEAEDVAAVKPTAKQTRSRKSCSAQEESSTVSKPAEKPVERPSRRSKGNALATENTAVLDEQNQTLSEGKIDAPVYKVHEEPGSLPEPEKATRQSRKRGNAQEESTTVLKPAEKPVERTSRRSKGNASATGNTVALDGKHEILSEGRIDVPVNKVHEESVSIPSPEKATRRSRRNASANDDSAQVDGKSETTAVSKPEEKQEGRASRRSTRNASSTESAVVLDGKNETWSKENVDVPENKVHEESESIPKPGKATRRSRRNASANDDSVNVDGQSETAGVIVKGNTTKSTSEVDQAAPRRSTRSAPSMKESVLADISDNQKAGQSVSITEEPAKYARTRTSKRKSVAPTSMVVEQPSRRSRQNSANDELMTLIEEKTVKGGKKTRSQKQQAKGTDTTESSVDQGNTVAEELPRKPTRGASRRQTIAVDLVAEHETSVPEGATAEHKKEKVATEGSDKPKARAKQSSGQGKRGQIVTKQPKQKSDIQVEVEVSTKELVEESYKLDLTSIEEIPEDVNDDSLPVMGAKAVTNDLRLSEQQVSHLVSEKECSYTESESMTLWGKESDNDPHTVVELENRDEQASLVPEELPTLSVAGVTTKGAAETASSMENAPDKSEKGLDDYRIPIAAYQNEFNMLVELPPTKTSSETQLEIGVEATHEEPSFFQQAVEECGHADSSPNVVDSQCIPGSGRDAKHGQAYSSVAFDNPGPIEPSLCHNHEEISVFQPADEECGQADFSPIHKGAAETASSTENAPDKSEKGLDDYRIPIAAYQNEFNMLVELPPTKTSSETQLEIGVEATHEEASFFQQAVEECGQADSSPNVVDSQCILGSGRDAKHGQAYSSVAFDNSGPIEPSLCHNHEEISVFQPADEECGQADFSPIHIGDSQFTPVSGKDAKHGQADSSAAADNLVPIEASLYTNDGSVCNELRETADEKAVLNQSASGDADVVVEQEKQSPLENDVENLGESLMVKTQDTLGEEGVNINEGESGDCDSDKVHMELFKVVNEQKQTLANLLEDFADEHASEELSMMLQRSQESHKKTATAERSIRSSISSFCRGDLERDDNVVTPQQEKVSETLNERAIPGKTYDEEDINVSDGENAPTVLSCGNVSDNVCVDEDSPMKGSGATSRDSNPKVGAESAIVFKNGGDAHGEVGAKDYLQTLAAKDVKSQDMEEYASGDKSSEEDSIVSVLGLGETSLRIDEYGQAESSLEPRHHAAEESSQSCSQSAVNVDKIAAAVLANDVASFEEGDKVDPLQADPEVLFKRKGVLELQDIHGSLAGAVSEEDIQVEATPGRIEEGDVFEDEMTSTSLLFKADTSIHAEKEERFDSDHVSHNNQTDSPSYVEDEEKLDPDCSSDVNEFEIKSQEASAVKLKHGSGDALYSNSNDLDEAPVESVELKDGSKVVDDETIRTPLSDACRSGNMEDVDGGATSGRYIDLENDADTVEQEEYPENRTVGISHSSPGTENVVTSDKVDDDKAICTPLSGAYRRSNIDDADGGATSGKDIDFKKDADVVEEEEDPEDATIGPSPFQHEMETVVESGNNVDFENHPDAIEEEDIKCSEKVQELTDLKKDTFSDLHHHSSVSDEHILIKELFEEATAEDESDSIGDFDVAVDEATAPSVSLLHDDKDIGISLAYPSVSTNVEDEEVMEPTEDVCLLEKNSYSSEDKDDTESSQNVYAELVEASTKKVQQMPDLEVDVGSSGCKFGSSVVANATAAYEGTEMNNYSTEEEDLESLQHVFEQPAKLKGDDERVDYAEAAETSLLSASVASNMEDEKLMEAATDAHVFGKTNHSSKEDDADASHNATAAYVELAETSPISASVPSNVDDENIMRTTEENLLFENNDLSVDEDEDADSTQQFSEDDLLFENNDLSVEADEDADSTQQFSEELVEQKSDEVQQRDASYMVDCGKQLFGDVGCSEYIETVTDTPISQGTKLEKEASLESNIYFENTIEFCLKGESAECQQEVSDCKGDELRSGGKLASTASKHSNFEEGEARASDCQSGKKLAEDEDAVLSPVSAVRKKQNLSSDEFEYEEVSSTVGRSAQTSVVKENRFDCLKSTLAYRVIDEENFQSGIKLVKEEDAMPSSLSAVSNRQSLIGAQSSVEKKDNFESLTSALVDEEGRELLQSGIKLAEEESATPSPLSAFCTKQNLSYSESEYGEAPSTVGRSAQTSVVKKNKFQCLTSSIAYKLIDEEKDKLNAASPHQSEDHAERQLVFDNSLLDELDNAEGTTTQQVLQYETDLEHLMEGLPEGDEESKDKAEELSAWDIDMFCGDNTAQECGVFSQIRTSEETEDMTRNSTQGNKLEHKDDIGNSSVGVLSFDQAEDNGEEVENMESSLREAFAAEETEVEENEAESTPKKPDVGEDDEEEENIRSSLRAMFASPINCEEDKEKKIEKAEMEEEATPMRRLGGRRDSMDEINSHLKKFHITSAVKGTRFRACTATPMRTPMRSSLGFQQSDMKENYPMMKIEQSANRQVERSGMKRNSQIDQLEKSVSKRRALGDLQNNPTTSSADK